MNRLRSNTWFIKLSESFVGVAADRLLFALFPFVSVKLFGAATYGEYTYYFSIATMLSILSRMGLDTGLLYYIPKTHNRFISGSFAIVCILSILVGGLYLFIEQSFLVYTPLFLLLSIHTLFLTLHKASGRIKEYYFISAFIRQAITLLVLFILYKIGASYGVIVASTAGYLFVNTILFVYNRKYFERIEFSKELILYSLPLLITSAMTLIMDQIDIIMLKQYYDETTVGIYNIAAKLATLPSYLLIIFNTVFAPKISELYHKGKEDELKKAYSISTKILMIISFVIVTIVIVLNQWLLGFFGKEFLVAKNIIIYRGIGQVVNCSVGSVWYMLSMTGRSKLNMIATCSAATLNVILNAILIPRMGMDGAAIASMIAVSFINILGYILVRKYFHVKAYGIF